ncbi:signal peptide peptidase SppA [Bacteroides nordii]|nr:signal peptide peptidase SppA [Bacteroides nordii]
MSWHKKTINTMKDFFKFTLATVTGIILSSIVLFFIGIMVIFGIVSSSDTETVVKKNSVMMLDLNGTLVERTQESLEGILSMLTGDNSNVYGLDDILASIKKAKENENIKGIYIQASALGSPYASLQAIRNALTDFKESGKFIVAYSDGYTQGLYYLSSVADKVILNPKGMIEWRGIASAPIFYKDLLQKVGIEMQIFKVGTYKSAVEPFIATEMSPANREQVTEFIGSIWGQVVSGVSASRNISPDSLNAYADRMLMFYPAEESVKCGLADTLIYKNNVRDYLKQLANVDKDDRLPILGLDDMINVKKNVPKDKSGDIVAVYYASGEITDQSGSAASEDGIVGNKVIRDLRKLKDDKDVKAVVLRVNSPGGSAFASEQIWHAVKELKAEKPVIVSMGDYAASGGYYISCVADTIIAEPTTLTGSIGIFGMVPNVKELADKVGITYDVVKTNKFADFGNLMRPFNNDERTLMQMMITEGYDTFLTRCAEGRHMTKEAIGKIAEGRVWTGETAKKLGLVDELGGIDKALDIAVKKANLNGYTVVSYPEKKDFLSTLLDTKPTNYVESQLMKSKLGDYYKDFSLLKNLSERSMIQARVPFELNIK